VLPAAWAELIEKFDRDEADQCQVCRWELMGRDGLPAMRAADRDRNQSQRSHPHTLCSLINEDR